MFKKPQSALDHYKSRRGIEAPTRPSRLEQWRAFQHWRWIRLGALAATLTVTYLLLQPGPIEPVDLAYEIDLSNAADGNMTITIIAQGNLPDYLDLDFPTGVFRNHHNGVRAHNPSGRVIGANGTSGRPLAISETESGWRLVTQNAARAGFIYEVSLGQVRGSEEDIRSHISTLVTGGLRAAGFEIFVEPRGVTVGELSVSIHNPQNITVLVPWPALLRNRDVAEESARNRSVDNASLGLGQGFQPAPGRPRPASSTIQNAATAVPSNLLYHPTDMEDLNNSLIICGDIRTLESQARGTVIQFATDRRWLFADEAALELVRRIARTEMGFFGEAPTDQITVLLSANEVTAAAGFDVYGVHTGSSVLVMMDPETTWGMLEDQAASVIAHEMFHSWLGEAIPQTDPQMLWFTEGATTWFASRMLVSSGIWAPQHARNILAARLQRDYADNPLFGRMPIATAASEVMANGEQVRFGYAGGMNACLALDQMLARATDSQRPLDEVIRTLYRQRHRGELTRPLLEETILAVTGVDCHVWFSTHVYGKTSLPPADELI